MFKKLVHFIVLLLITAGVFGQAPRLVLFEEFTGENCGPCAETNPYVQQLVDANPNTVLWVRYQCNIPSAGTLYYQDQTDVDPRMTYYGVNFAPWGEQDGLIWDSTLLSGNSYQPYSWATTPSYLSTEAAITSPFTISVTHTFNASADSFFATVTVTGAENYVVSKTGDLKLRVAMIENLNFTIPPGDNGETQFPDAVRKMYPNATGTTMPDSSANQQVQTFTFSGPVPSYVYDKTQVRIVAFIQDDNTQKVQQAGVSTYYTFPNDVKAVSLQGAFVVCDTPYAPTFNISNNGTQTLTSALIRVKLDAAQIDSFAWTGSLAAGNSTVVNLPNLSATMGSHNLTAIASYPNGTTDVNPGNDTSYSGFAITSAPAGLPLIQGFENASIPGWFIQDVTGSPYTWVRQSYGDSSTHSYMMDFYDAAAGAVNNFYAPTLDLTGLTSVKMKFSYADAQYDFGGGDLSQDSLYILVSADCGRTWATVYANGGNTLATVAANTNPYTPVQADWRNDTVDLSSMAGNGSVIVQFNTVSGNGNNLYIDNINIYNAGALGIKPVSDISSMSLFPNPAADLLNVQLQLAQASEISFEVTNALGQVVMSGPAEIQGQGANALEIHTNKLQSGVYFLSIISGTERTSKMFAVIH